MAITWDTTLDTATKAVGSPKCWLFSTILFFHQTVPPRIIRNVCSNVESSTTNPKKQLCDVTVTANFWGESGRRPSSRYKRRSRNFRPGDSGKPIGGVLRMNYSELGDSLVGNHGLSIVLIQLMSTLDFAKPWLFFFGGYSSNSHFMQYLNDLNGTPLLNNRLGFINPGLTFY
jgi:hypothetical protein